MNINQKITLKGLVCNVGLLTKSGYNIALIDETCFNKLDSIGFSACKQIRSGQQIPVEIDVVSLGGDMLEKNVIGGFYTVHDNSKRHIYVDNKNVFYSLPIESIIQ